MEQQGSTQSPAESQAPQQSAQAAPAANNFTIPAEYQGKEWSGKIKTHDDLWKTLDGAQSLLGKRPAGIPTSDAPQEEWDKFFAASRPEKADAYQFSNIEGLPEGFDLKPIQQAASQLAYEAGLTPKQADILFKNYMKEEMGAAQKAGDAYKAKQKELDAEFDKVTKQHFGDNFEAASKIATEMVAQYVPQELRSAYEELADKPKALAAFAAAMQGAYNEINRIKKEYGAEGNINNGNGGAGATQDISEVRKELAKLRTSSVAKDPFHPDYKKTMEGIKALSSKVDSYYSKAQ